MRPGIKPLSGIAEPNELEEFDNPITGVLPRNAAVKEKTFADLTFDGVQRIEARHRLLKNHGDLIAPNGTQPLQRGGCEFFAAEADRSRPLSGGSWGKQLEHTQGGDRFA